MVYLSQLRKPIRRGKNPAYGGSPPPVPVAVVTGAAGTNKGLLSIYFYFFYFFYPQPPPPPPLPAAVAVAVVAAVAAVAALSEVKWAHTASPFS